MAKVSVIIPVYNVEKYLRECLDSVVNQTLKDIEIICVDDDWEGKFDFLKDYCEVIYLPRTPDVSSTQTKKYLSGKI